jgi:hypothetical protein
MKSRLLGGRLSMTPKQSLTRKQSLIRCSLTMLSAALLATAWVVGISTPASAAAPRALEIGLPTTSNEQQTCPSPDRCAILQDHEFRVPVRVVDRNGEPATVSKDTTIVLEKISGEGSLIFRPGESEVTILRGGSEATFTVLRYTQSGNPTLRVRVTSGVQLSPDEITVPIALTAVGDKATRGQTFDLDDSKCGDGGGVPNSDEPTCGHLITKSAAGDVVMSVGSCDGLGPNNTNPCRTVGGASALVVTLFADIQNSRDDPNATMILACDKVLCGQTGVPKLPVYFTPQNTGPLNDVAAPACQRKGVLDAGLKACVDYVSSMRSDSDLYLFVLFNGDARIHS